MKSLLALLAAVALLQAQPSGPSPLESLVGTERAFAARATEIGWRDAFLEFFADDAIALGLTPGSAKERLRTQPSQPFAVAELTWEPRTGQVASSGELGWLTGPSTSINHAAPDPKPRYGNYLSVWKRVGQGPWRVLIDVGVYVPAPATFPPGFTPFALESRYDGGSGNHARTLSDADRELNRRIAQQGSGGAYGETLAPAARLHRGGHVPPVGRRAGVAWLERYAPSMTAAHSGVGVASSGDLGYTYGTYELKGQGAEGGAYLRVWQRDASGAWWVVADVSQPIKRGP